MITKIFLLASFFLIQTIITLAQLPVVVADDASRGFEFKLDKLEFLADSTNTLSFDEIAAPHNAENFNQYKTYQNKDFLPGMSYWIRFKVQHQASAAKVWIIEFYDQTIDHIEAYVPHENGHYEKILLGDHYSFSNRKFRHKNFEIPLDIRRDTVVNYYFKVKSHEFADVRIAFRPVDRFIYHATTEYFLFGTFYGMILIISLYNFLVYLAIREIKNIIYICYMLSVALYALSLDGIGFQYLWPAYPEWNDFAVGISQYLVVLWALMFTRRFLNTRINARSLDDVLKWTIILRSGLFLYSLLFHHALFAHREIDIIPLSLIFYTGISTWMKGYRPARFFVVAYGVLFTGFFVRLLVQFNVLPFTIVSHYSLHISFMLEMLFLTFALGDRIRILKNNRDRALMRIIREHEINMELKDKVTRELEQKVQERTVELDQKNRQLEETNHKLEQQAHEISQINSMLDLDNWKLKNSLKEVLNERLLEKTMDYNQFKTLYPDDLACYRFLETLKWEKDFCCRKCRNEKFFNGAQKFSRRCTRCGYNESITAYTIFKGIKFPIEKAFYIAYLVVVGSKNITLEVLAEQLSLRVNTLWAFRRKVSDRLHELEKIGKRPVASRWEEVILFTERHPRTRKISPKLMS